MVEVQADFLLALKTRPEIEPVKKLVAGIKIMLRPATALTGRPFRHIKPQAMKTVLPWFPWSACGGLALLCLVAFGLRGCEPAKVSSPPDSFSVHPNNSKSEAAFVPVPEPDAKSLRHYRSSMALLGALILWNLLIPVLFLFTGFSARMRSWAQRWGRKWYSTFALYCIGLGLVYYLASLPLNYYAGFVQPHSFELSNQTFARWLGNYIKGAAVVVALGLGAGWFPFLVIRKSPRRWWLYLGLLAAPALCALEFLQPVLIDPLFHHFQPLQNQSLEARILAEAARGGIEGSRVYEVNMSADTKTLNAYVTGFLGTKRIVLWDTTLKTLDEDELAFILGHEMGHYVLGHVIKKIAFDSALIVLLYYAVHLLAGRLIARFHTRFGFNSLSDFAATPLLILLIVFLALAGLPVPMAFSRHLEHEADRFGLELTHNNHAAATAFLKLRQHDLGIFRPGIIVEIWLFSHPSAGERIDFCNHYRPWESGEPSRYDKYIKQ
jgi:Zn-dependent protease with chaperone function